MSALNLPAPAADDGPVDYAAHVLKRLQARLDLAAVERIDTVHGDVTFYAWHTSRDAYACYLLYARFLVKGVLQALKMQMDRFSRAYPMQTEDFRWVWRDSSFTLISPDDFPVLTGLVVPGATNRASRWYNRMFDLPLLIIPIPSAFVPMESEVMPC